MVFLNNINRFLCFIKQLLNLFIASSQLQPASCTRSPSPTSLFPLTKPFFFLFFVITPILGRVLLFFTKWIYKQMIFRPWLPIPRLPLWLINLASIGNPISVILPNKQRIEQLARKPLRVSASVFLLGFKKKRKVDWNWKEQTGRHAFNLLARIWEMHLSRVL